MKRMFLLCCAMAILLATQIAGAGCAVWCVGNTAHSAHSCPMEAEMHCHSSNCNLPAVQAVAACEHNDPVSEARDLTFAAFDTDLSVSSHVMDAPSMWKSSIIHAVQTEDVPSPPDLALMAMRV